MFWKLHIEIGTNQHCFMLALTVHYCWHIGNSFFQRQSPCLVIWSVNSKKVIIAELTIPIEVIIDWAHQGKLEKYKDLREQCVKSGWSTDILPLEIGCQGFFSNSTFTFLTKLGLSPAEKREYIKKNPKWDCNCIQADIAFIQSKHHPIKSGSIMRYCWGGLG